MASLFTWCHLRHAQECTHSLWHLLKSSRATAPCAWAAYTEQVLHVLTHMCLPGASYTCLAPRATAFWGVLSKLCQITMRLPADRAIVFSLLKELELPNITGYALRWKSHIHCRNQAFSHGEPRGCGPLQNAVFLLKAKSLAYGKNMPLQAEGSRGEADASSTGMVQPEKGLAVVVAWSPLMVCCSPQASHFPQILGGSLLSPCWAPGRWCPGVRCRSVMAEHAHRPQITSTCSGSINPPLEWELQPAQQQVPAASLKKHNNLTSKIIFQRKRYIL